MQILAIGTISAIASAAGSLFSVIAGYLGIRAMRQKRANDPDMIANVDASRDVQEADNINKVVSQGDKTGQVSDEERRLASEN